MARLTSSESIISAKPGAAVGATFGSEWNVSATVGGIGCTASLARARLAGALADGEVVTFVTRARVLGAGFSLVVTSFLSSLGRNKHVRCGIGRTR